MVADPPLERQGFRTDGPRGRGALSFRPLLADVSPYARIKELPRERDRGFESRLLQRGVRCELDAAQDRMTVLGAAKVPFFNRDTLAAMLRQRRSERTCGTCDRSTPARLLLGQRTPDRLSPTARKCESWTGECTAITRQFAQSSPRTEGSIWSRRGKPPPWANSFQSRSTRSTSRRSLCIAIGSWAFRRFYPVPEVDRIPARNGWGANRKSATDSLNQSLAPTGQSNRHR